MFRLADGGNCVRNCGRSFLIAVATATVFVPGCRWMARITERSMLLPVMNQAAVLLFSTLFVTLPIWSSRTGEPLRYATISGRYCAEFSNWPVACTVYAVECPYKVPVGRFTLAFLMAFSTSSMPIW